MARVIMYEPVRRSWVQFDEPALVIEAWTLDDVLPALERVEQIVNSETLYATGFVSYDASPAFDASLIVRKTEGRMPLLWFGLYRSCTDIKIPHPDSLNEIAWQPSITTSEYLDRIGTIKDHIRAGNTYQVNFSFKLRGEFHGNAEAFFFQLMAAQPSTHGAFIDTSSFAICSASPELFFSLDGSLIEARPMKGTRKRGLTQLDDKRISAALHLAEKDRAENLMIVDMMRNDIGRIAEVGSVEVPSLFDVERYPTVWQMTSRVSGRTSADLPGIFRALFPCASVTGAPKARTMHIIADLENEARNIYTGAIGMIMPGRRARFSVAIRTVLIDKQKGEAEYGVGGGIVWGSTPEGEYAECLAKSRVLTEIRPEFSLFETILYTPQDGFFLLEDHLKRLRSSAGYFGFVFQEERVAAAVHNLESEGRLGREPVRIRMLLDSSGEVRFECSPVDRLQKTQPVRVKLAASPVDSDNLFLYHKTTHRGVYESALAEFTDVDDVILWNQTGEITESTIANVVVEIDGALYTPPVSCGLLAGTFRSKLLLERLVGERVITVEELMRSPRVFLVNSVRMWREAVLVPDTSTSRPELK